MPSPDSRADWPSSDPDRMRAVNGDPVPGTLSRRLDALWRLDEEARIRRGRVRDAVEPEDRPAETSRWADTLLAVGTLVVVIVCLLAIGLFSIG